MMQLGEFGEKKLRILCENIGFQKPDTEAKIDLFRAMAGSWFEVPVGSSPPWKNDITDDGTPFEFSLAFRKNTRELRILVEPQQYPFHLTSNWDAGVRFSEKIARLPGTSVDRFHKIKDLFQPTSTSTSFFSIWYAATMNSAGHGEFKIYLNPRIHGDEDSPRVVLEALSRLGFENASSFFCDQLKIRELENKTIFFSLDLTQSEDARIKVYFVNPTATADLLESQMESCENYLPGDVKRWTQMFAGREHGFQRRPIITCYQFVSSCEKPRAALHVPVRCYQDNDQLVLEKILKALKGMESDCTAISQALTKMAGRPLNQTSGLITYVSLRRESVDEVRLTAYLAPGTYSHGKNEM